jgi:hypothetical protein
MNHLHFFEIYIGADRQIRTADLILTKDALYQLSYISAQNGAGSENRTRIISLEG